jgi:NitT/TauT family transport system substrate-binding protein
VFGDASRLSVVLGPRSRRATLGGGAISLASLLAACGGESPAAAPTTASSRSTTAPTSAQPTVAPAVQTAAPTAAPPKVITDVSLRLSWIKNTEFAGVFAAMEKGYYKDEGINLSVNPSAQNLPEVQAVAGKTDTIGLSGGASLFLARAQGVPVKAFGATFQKGPGCFLWKEGSGIKGIADFKGKKIGHQQTARASTEAMLTINNLKVDDVTLVPVGFDVQPLLTGQVDVLTGLVTNQVLALEGAGEKIGYAPYADLGFAFYWNTPFALEETIASKKELLVAWLRATARGWDYALKNADEVAKFVVDKYGEGLKLDNQLLELKRETPLIQTDFTKQKGLMWMDRAVWQSGHDILLNRTKQLEKQVPVDDVMTLDILEKVGKIGG